MLELLCFLLHKVLLSGVWQINKACTLCIRRLSVQVLRKNFRDLVYVCTFGEDDTSEKRVVYSDTDEDRILLMVRESIYFIWHGTWFVTFLSILSLFQKAGGHLFDFKFKWCSPAFRICAYHFLLVLNWRGAIHGT